VIFQLPSVKASELSVPKKRETSLKSKDNFFVE
jgi:hypothetical protein